MLFNKLLCTWWLKATHIFSLTVSVGQVSRHAAGSSTEVSECCNPSAGWAAFSSGGATVCEGWGGIYFQAHSDGGFQFLAGSLWHLLEAAHTYFLAM